MDVTVPIYLRAVLAEKDIGSAIFKIYEGGIYHVEIKRGQKVTMDFVMQGYQFLDEFGGGQYYNIYEFSSFSDVEPEVRDWAASPTNNSYTLVDAIVISSFPQKILADFYVRFNKPFKPTKIFTSVHSACEWIRSIEKEP